MILMNMIQFLFLPKRGHRLQEGEDFVLGHLQQNNLPLMATVSSGLLELLSWLLTVSGTGVWNEQRRQ